MGSRKIFLEQRLFPVMKITKPNRASGNSQERKVPSHITKSELLGDDTIYRTLKDF